MKQEHKDQVQAAVDALRARFAVGKVKNFYFVACGGSQATMMPFDRETPIPSFIYTANEFNYAKPKAFGPESVVITVSHSGTTPETVAAAQTATDCGALSIAFSNVVDSPLWKAAGYPIHYDHGPETDMTDRNNAVLYDLAFSILTIIDPDQAARWEQGVADIDKVDGACKATWDIYREVAESFATANKRAPLIYTMGSGVNYGEMYSLTSCLFMEMQWIHSNAIHSGEYFHGPFEVTDYDVPFVIALSCGVTRHLDERALAFAKKFSERLLVFDEEKFDFNGIDESLHEYFAQWILGVTVRSFVDKLAHDRGHALSVRRYMWQMEY